MSYSRAIILSVALHILLFLGLSRSNRHIHLAGDGSPVKVKLVDKGHEEGEKLKEEMAKKSDPKDEIIIPKTAKSTNVKSCDKSFGGVGIIISQLGRISYVASGYPADKAGVLAGDIVLFPTDTKDIKGVVGTEVELMILRGEDTMRFNMIRETICIGMVPN